MAVLGREKSLLEQHETPSAMRDHPEGTRLPLSLGALFLPLPIAADRDGDGLIDAITLHISVSPTMTHPVLWAAILNLTARLAFISVAADLPLVGASRTLPAGGALLRIEPPRRNAASCRAEIRRSPSEGSGVLRLSGTDPAAMAGLLDGLDARLDKVSSAPAGWWAIRLQAGAESFIEVLDKNGREIQILPLRRSDPGVRPAARATPQGVFDLLDPGSTADWFVTDAGDPCRTRLALRLHLDCDRLSMASGSALARAMVRLVSQVNQMPLYPVVTAAPPSDAPVLRVIEQPSRSGRPAAGTVIRAARDGVPALTLQGSAQSLAGTLDAWLPLALCQSGPFFAQAQAFRGRVANFKAILDGKGFWGRWAHGLAAADPALAAGWPALPRRTAQRVTKACRALQLPEPRSRGEKSLRGTFAWAGETDRLLEQVHLLPDGSGPLQGTVWVSKPRAVRIRLGGQITALLKAKGYAPRVTVANAYKPGLCWLLEQVLPQLAQRGAISRIELRYQPFAVSKMQLELRSRWLKEIFPGPDLLARALNIDLAQIQFTETAEQPDIYRVAAWDPDGNLVLDESVSPLWNSLPYRPAEPGEGAIHPTTAGFRLQTPSGARFENRLPTDRQHFWIHFQQEWLPQLEAQMRTRLAAGGEMDAPAFWETIRIAVAIDETDERLGLDGERICPMEALHEDLYFYTLNAFQRFAAAHGLPDTLGLGAVLPIVSSRTTGGRPRAVLTAKPLDWLRAPQGAPAAALPLVSMARTAKGAGWEFCFQSTSNPARVRNLTAVARAWGYDCRFSADAVFLKAALPKRSTAAAHPSPRLRIPTTRYLSRSEAERLLDTLAAQANLQVWVAGRTLRGRPIRVIEACSVAPAEVVSIARLRLLKPTLLINARHHANEISSTPAVLQFMADLSRGGSAGLLRRANVACIAMENIDGVEYFEAIAGQGSDHKLHAARYNAVGAEFYGDYFRSPPRFGEAAVKPLMWRRWLPELMVDLHGVPGHEWDQPFAGYTPARFEQYWIPNTFVYAILPFLDEPDHLLHPVTHRLAAAMRRALGGEHEIIGCNRRLAERYGRYARGPEPDIFPAADHAVLTLLPPLGRTREVNFARRYPHVTQSEVVVEVPDEGSQGRALHLCVRAHYKIQEALLRALRSYRGTLEYTVGEGGRLPELVWQVERIAPQPVVEPI